MAQQSLCTLDSKDRDHEVLAEVFHNVLLSLENLTFIACLGEV